MEDGVVFRMSDNELLLTSARPALSWLTSHLYGGRVALEDVTDDYAMLAVQGPRSRDVLAGLVPEVTACPSSGSPRPSSRRSRSPCPAPATPATSGSS